jgi:hypothetical protein
MMSAAKAPRTKNIHTYIQFGDATTRTGEPFETEIKSTGQTLQVPR